MFDRLPSEIDIKHCLLPHNSRIKFHFRFSMSFVDNFPNWRFTSVADWTEWMINIDVNYLWCSCSYKVARFKNRNFPVLTVHTTKSIMRATLNDKFYVNMPEKTPKIHDISYVSLRIGYTGCMSQPTQPKMPTDCNTDGLIEIPE